MEDLRGKGPEYSTEAMCKALYRQGAYKIRSTTRLWGLCRYYTLYFHRRKWTWTFLYHYSFSCRWCHGGDIRVEDYAYAAASESCVKGEGPFGEIGYDGQLVDASSTSGAVQASNDVAKGGDDPARATCEHWAHLCSALCRYTAVSGSNIVSCMSPLLF
jgi:hypothetical protein